MNTCDEIEECFRGHQ